MKITFLLNVTTYTGIYNLLQALKVILIIKYPKKPFR